MPFRLVESWRLGWSLAVCAGVAALAGTACGPDPNARVTAVPKAAAPTSKATVALVRLGGDSEIPEANTKDIKDGLSLAGYEEGTNLEIVESDAGGDLEKAKSAIRDAAAKKVGAIIVLEPTVAMAAKELRGEVPVAYHFLGEPTAVGLAKNKQDHEPGMVGVYNSLTGTISVEIARAANKDAKAFGIVFDPKNPVSVGDLEALKRCRWEGVAVETAEVADPNDPTEATKALLAKPVQAILLVRGLGAKSSVVIDLAKEAKVPVYGYTTAHAKQGAFINRVPTTRNGAFEVGRTTGRLLAGEDAGSLPLAESLNFRNVINQKSSDMLGVAPPGFLLREVEWVDRDESKAPPGPPVMKGMGGFGGGPGAPGKKGAPAPKKQG